MQKQGKNLFQQSGQWLIILLPASMYFPMQLNTLVIVATLLYALFGWFTHRLDRSINWWYATPLFLLYLLIFVGFLYDQPIEFVFTDLEKKASLVAIPLAITLIQPEKEVVRRALACFFWTGILMTTIAFVGALMPYSETGALETLTNHELSGIVGFHATYLSFYLLFALVYPLLILQSETKSGYKYLVLLGTLAAILYLVLLGSRIAWILLCLGLLTYFVFGGNYSWAKRALFISVFVILAANTLWISPVRERFKELINYNNQYESTEVWGGRSIRLLIWDTCSELISERPFRGYGSSTAVQEALDVAYKKNGVGPILYMMRDGYRFNPHNQFFSDVMKYGIFAGMLFFLALMYFGINYLLQKNFVGIYFLLLVVGFSMTETVFELNKGIVFICYFIPVSFFLTPSIPKNET